MPLLPSIRTGMFLYDRCSKVVPHSPHMHEHDVNKTDEFDRTHQGFLESFGMHSAHVSIGHHHCLWVLHKRWTSSDPTDKSPMEPGPVTSVAMLLGHHAQSISKGTVH
ncbi:hypothetical protein L798_09526 [Zootermopsis nevadensis]|uniref:Uncharacterized protein n=1 Tax=Zootermopsis nevadensis TaxID=136037 RepID=A0A067RVP7_ZOONE|nr:hypothetical protein L798_09526 [Zootermopsis nevadensis]